ncbi:MAG: glycosyltransferase, partial [Planctomycetota bacterium]
MKAIRDGSVDVSVLIVNYNSTGLALDLMRSLLAQDPRAPDGSRLRVECVFVDNASPMVDDEKLSEIRNLIGSELPGHVVLNTQNAGYAGGMNLAYRHARGEYVFVLNPDVMFFPDCTGRLYRYLVTHPDAGAAGPQAWWEHDKRVRLPPNILPTMWDLFFCTLAHIVPSVNRRYMDARVRATLRT